MLERAACYWVAVRARSRTPTVAPMYMSRVMRTLACPARHVGGSRPTTPEGCVVSGGGERGGVMTVRYHPLRCELQQHPPQREVPPVTQRPDRELIQAGRAGYDVSAALAGLAIAALQLLRLELSR